MVLHDLRGASGRCIPVPSHPPSRLHAIRLPEPMPAPWDQGPGMRFLDLRMHGTSVDSAGHGRMRNILRSVIMLTAVAAINIGVFLLCRLIHLLIIQIGGWINRELASRSVHCRNDIRHPQNGIDIRFPLRHPYHRPDQYPGRASDSVLAEHETCRDMNRYRTHIRYGYICSR